MSILTVLKFIGPPGSLAFLSLCCVIGLAMKKAGWIGLAKGWLVTVYACYVVAGIPAVAGSIGSALSPYAPIQDLSSIRDADSIIVLHGDNLLGRVRETKRLFDATNAPVVVVLGDDTFARILMDHGIPERRLVIDSWGHTTVAQIRIGHRILGERNLKKPIVVASRLQIPRIAELLRAEQIDARLGPAPLDDEPPQHGIWQIVPMYKALCLTRDAIYEHLALRYYRHQRLIGVS